MNPAPVSFFCRPDTASVPGLLVTWEREGSLIRDSFSSNNNHKELRFLIRGSPPVPLSQDVQVMGSKRLDIEHFFQARQEPLVECSEDCVDLFQYTQNSAQVCHVLCNKEGFV